MDTLSNIDRAALDWHKNKPVEIKSRGIMSLVSMEITSAPLQEAEPRQRCIWPNSFMNSGSRVISRRVWGRAV